MTSMQDSAIRSELEGFKKAIKHKRRQWLSSIGVRVQLASLISHCVAPTLRGQVKDDLTAIGGSEAEEYPVVTEYTNGNCEC